MYNFLQLLIAIG